jgi:hypothetical protein
MRNIFPRPAVKTAGYIRGLSLQQASSRGSRFYSWLPVFGAMVVGALACSGPVTPPDIIAEKPILSIVVRPDLTAADLVLNSPVTLSTLQAVISFDPTQIQPSNAVQGEDGLRVSNIFDDAARVPGKLLVGLADVNQNPLPRSGKIVSVSLANATSSDVLGVEGVVAVDIFGNKVEVEVKGTSIP